MFAPYKLYALTEVARDFGVSASHVLQGTGLSPKMLQDPKARTTVEQYVLASSNVLKQCDDLQLPFRVGKNIHLSAYGLYGFALLCSPTVREGFNLAVRYHGLATPVFSIAWREVGDRFIWYFPNEFHVQYAEPLKQFLLAQQLAQHITHVKDVARTERSPLIIKVAHRSPAENATEMYEAQLGCPVEFSSDATEIHYERSLLDDRPPLTNPVTLAMLRESCELLIDRIVDDSTATGRVTRLIMERPGQVLTMEAVAATMCLTPRTLRRRLAAEGTTFSNISDQVRLSLAEKYLSANDFTVEDIAVLLGFADASNFRQSFKRWSGLTPARYRQTANLNEV